MATEIPPPLAEPPPPPESFEVVLERHGAEIYRFLLDLARNRDEADDLYQESALKAFSAWDRLEPGSNHRAWLYRIASNAFLSDRRKHGRVGLLDETAQGDLVAGQPDEAARLDARNLLARVSALVRSLPPKQRIALVARKHHDLSYAEIGELLHCSEAAARANVHEALRKLRAQLGDDLG